MLKNILLLLTVCIAFLNSLLAQSDNCSSATLISTTATCTSPTNGTTVGATESIPGCAGNADDDVWYRFVATSTSHSIIVTPSAGMDAVVQLFSGTCSGLISLTCRDNFFSGGVETINYSGLTIGATYRVRVYHYGVGSGTGTFTMCVTTPPAAPANDICGSAVNLTVNTTCTATSGTTVGATQSFPGCSGTADEDVWYQFTATNSVQTVTVTPTTSSLDMVVEVYSGTSCTSLTSIACVDNTFSGSAETVNLVGLTVGNVYRIRTYDYYTGSTGNFNICVTGTPTATPTNDNPCSAIALPTVTSACNYLNFTNVGATATTSAPNPTSCVGGSATGTYGSSSADVWFAITVPSTGHINITSRPNMGSGRIVDGAMALYSGTCGSLTQIACSNNNNYPGANNDLLPMINRTGLTPGSTVYLRYWGVSNSTGNFGLCVTTATNDDCANALYICDINGYNGSTSAAYTADRPGNMHGNNETPAGVNLVDGTNSGGPFGYYPPSNVPGPFSSPSIDVNIENNSWIRFTAAAATATLTVSIYDCFVGNYPSGGIQMQIFSSTGCSNFSPISNFEENSTGFVITANGLTVGNDYILMVDGYAGDICSYTISANTGVLFPDIPDVPPVCAGTPVTLTAPPGATSYLWQHDGSTTQSVTVAPGTTQTYYCEVTGLCTHKQTLDVQVVVNPSPLLELNYNTNQTICNGESITLTASGANTYSWNTGATTASITVSPTSTTTYTVTGYVNGCQANKSITINVNPLPTISGSPTVTPSNCGASNGSISGYSVSPAGSTVVWTNASGAVVGNTINVNNLPVGNYTLTVTHPNGCVRQVGPVNISNPNAPAAPVISVSTTNPCIGSSVTFSATSVAGATFSWTGPQGFITSNPSFSITNFSTVDQGNYCVTVTVAGCTSTPQCQNVTLASAPNIDIASSSNGMVICDQGTAVLSASGGVSYTWTGPNSYTGSGNSITIQPFTSANSGNYVVTGTGSNGCTNTDTIEVTSVNNPTIILTSESGSNIFCNGGSASLTAAGATTYTWTAPDNTTYSGTTITIPNVTTTNSGWYLVTGTDANNCSSTDSIHLILATPTADATVGNGGVICPGTSVNFYSSEGISYNWTGPQGYITSDQGFVLTGAKLENAGWYYVTVTDSNHCTVTDSTHLTIEANPDCLIIPDLITPDNDKLNDVWYIKGLEAFPNVSVEIYNRWGNLIYKTDDYKNDWGGEVTNGLTIGSGKVPLGTYFYILNLNNSENTPPYKGYIEVQY